jgi:transposase, IS5 family
MRVKNWDYRELRERIADGLMLRQFADFYCARVPKHDAFQRGFIRLTPQTLKAINDLVVQAAVDLGLEDGTKLRVHVAPSLDRHMEAFGRVPELYGSDRGFFSEQNIASCAQEGVKVVCIPQRGGKKTPEREAYEKSADFKQGQRFRAGIEGRISVLFRGRGMKRCLAEGHERFELWVAAAVLANNLMNVAALLTRRAARRRKAI